MGEGQHVQVLLDVVVPDGQEPVLWVVRLIELLNVELYRQGFAESAWVVPAPGDRA